MRLEGKVALITGGTSGIGSATGGKALFIRSDVRLSKDCRDAVDQTLEHFGKIDILFNNAGVFHPKNIPDCAAKGGLIIMAKAMAIDHGPDGIRVNCVCPGDVLRCRWLSVDAAYVVEFRLEKVGHAFCAAFRSNSRLFPATKRRNFS